MKTLKEGQDLRRMWFIALALIVPACGTTSETSAGAQTTSTSAPTTVLETTAAPTTAVLETTALPETTAVPTTAVPGGDSPVQLVDLGLTLTAGVTYQTTTEVPVQFSVGDASDGSWRLAAQNGWSTTIILSIAGQASDIGSEPGFNIAVAELGATPESVATAMLESRRDTIGYIRSEGLFGGRDAIILEGAHTETGYLGVVPVLTGEKSNFVVLFADERVYRSQIFEEQGRVFIISQDSHPDDFELILAETAPVLESIDIVVGT